MAAVEDALAADRMILLVAQRDSESFDPELNELYTVGTVASVTTRATLPDGRLKILIQGVAKARILGPTGVNGRVRIEEILGDDGGEWTVEGEALVRAVRGRVEQLLPLKDLPPEVLAVTANIDKPGRLADTVASNLRLRVAEAQEVLETVDSLARLRKVDALVRRELEVTTMQAEIQTQAKEEMSRGERESFLREQLRAIQNELGEVEGGGNEIEEYRAKLAAATFSPESFEEANRQVQRLSTMHPDGPEAQVVRNYLDWLIGLPWDRCSPDRLDLAQARGILDTDHAHLNKVKDRILEFLSVRKLRDDSRGPILCFAGPPGVGKTSLGRSIARSMGREFARISLGGVRDEAEIRGHRRTYVGAMPGRIIQAMKQAGTSNPVIMLDEIDKLSNDFKGDPAAALLEVLDSEQNKDFSDHFLSIPFDLSRVLFIATANRLDMIPGPLGDRMETVRLSGYSQEEKVEIASRFLIPRQIVEHGLTPEQMSWSSGAIDGLVSGYTHEAGVRNLERQVAGVCRKVARKAAEGDLSKVSITRPSLTRYLGAAPYARESEARLDEVGVVKGLAWTEAGGELLPVEASLASGSGLVLTGQMGDVMKESGQTALSFVRTTLRELEDSLPGELSASEVHVHVPDGATPKDGPSAGVAIATAIFSAATGTAVRGDVAMTGEITLRGKVLPVGGVREKALAALRSGITEVVLPRQCMKDVEAIPRELRRKLTFIPVGDMSEVLEVVLCTPPGVKASHVARATPSPAHVHASFKPRS